MRASSRDDQVEDWSGLLEVAKKTKGELTGVAPFLAALEGAHAQAVSLRSRRDALVVSAIEATAQVNEAFATGRDAASALRSYIKGVLGPRSEKLLRYGIRPFRKRRRVVGRRRPASG